MSIVKVSTKGQLIIPVHIRKKLNIKPHTKLELHLEGEKIVAYPVPEDPIRALRGALKLRKPAVEIMKEVREEEKRREDKKLGRLTK